MNRKKRLKCRAKIFEWKLRGDVEKLMAHVIDNITGKQALFKGKPYPAKPPEAVHMETDSRMMIQLILSWFESKLDPPFFKWI